MSGDSMWHKSSGQDEKDADEKKINALKEQVKKLKKRIVDLEQELDGLKPKTIDQTIPSTAGIWLIEFPLDNFGNKRVVLYGVWDQAYKYAETWLNKHYGYKWQFVRDPSGNYQFHCFPFSNGWHVPLQITQIDQEWIEIGIKDYEVVNA